MSKRFSRRTFIRAASTAIAAPMIIPASALGLEKGTPAPSNRIGVGFIGMGKQMGGHLNHVAGKPAYEVISVCDVDKTRRDHAKKTVETKYAKLERKDWKGCHDTEDFREVLSRKDIDVVYIATPDHWHAIPIVEAAKAKKDIYCEKPLTLTIEEAKLCVDACRKYNVILQTGSQQRSGKEFLKACEYVRNGRLGKIKEVIVDVGGPSRACDLPEEAMEPGLNWDLWLGQAPMRPYHSALSPRGVHNHYPAFRSYKEYSGGSMTDFGAHHFDIMQWGLGMDDSGPDEIIPPDAPKANVKTPGDPLWQKGVKFIYHKTPVGDNIVVTHGSSGGILFKGEKGEILVNRGKLSATPPEIFNDPITDKDIRLINSTNHHDNFFNAVRTREKPICDVEIGARSVTVCHLGNLAYWHGKKMKWDPKNWKFLDDTNPKWLGRESRDKWPLPTI